MAPKVDVVMGSENPVITTPGSKEYPCGKCGVKLLISTSSQGYIEAGAQVLCESCALALGEAVEPMVTEAAVRLYNEHRGTNYTAEELQAATKLWMALKRRQS